MGALLRLAARYEIIDLIAFLALLVGVAGWCIGLGG